VHLSGLWLRKSGNFSEKIIDIQKIWGSLYEHQHGFPAVRECRGMGGHKIVDLREWTET